MGGGAMGGGANVLVFRDRLLPLSETFIYENSLALSRYKAYFLGSRRAFPSLPLPEDRLFLINPDNSKSLRSEGFRSELEFKLLGRLPSRVLEWAQALSPKVVHAHFAPDGTLGLPLAKALGVPLVVSLLGTDITMSEGNVLLRSWPNHRLYLFRKRKLQREARLFIVPSRFLLRKALERGYPREKLVLLPHGVDTEFFRPAPEKVDYGRVLYVGRLIELKGLPFLMAALASLVDEFSQLRLIVIGDGPKRREYEELGRRLLGDRVLFLGAQPREKVLEEMQRAYLFSMPSVTMPTGEAEAFGVVYLEAQACGVPVVAFASGGVPEVVRHGETGFLVPERDVKLLSKAIREILLSRETWYEFSDAAVKLARSFDSRKQNSELESIYDGL